MYYIYILRSLKDSNLYTGCTSDLSKRIKAHNNGKVKSTQKRKPFALVYFEEYDTLVEARKREVFLKSYEGGKLKKGFVAAFSKDRLAEFS